MSKCETPSANWLCPTCRLSLSWMNGTWRCANGHCYDRAKEGYVNLLLAQQKSSKDPGDNKDMVLARRTFLEQDYYLPLVTEVGRLLLTNRTTTQDSVEHTSSFTLYDAGCGEGYYLAKIKKLLGLQALNVSAAGSDISKPAIQKAAKKYPDIEYAVASSFNLPVESNSQDAVIQVFAPSSSAEIQRILKDAGLWLKVTPASQHLFELKELVYQHAAAHDIEADVPEGFDLLTISHVQFQMSLTSPHQRESLLMMTPFYWSISEENKDVLSSQLESVKADFNISVFKKQC